MLQALSRLPEVLEKMSKRGGGGLIDQKGLGKPQVLGEGAEDRFRVWALKLEDYVAGVIGGKIPEVLEWAAEQDNPIAQMDIDNQFGAGADLLDQWDEVDEMNQQVYTILRATTEGAVFDLVENAPKGAGLEAWRALRRKFDPSTGGRKRIMLQALTSPERSSHENLGSALERWKALRNRRPQEGPVREAGGLSRQPGDECAGEVGAEGDGTAPHAELHEVPDLRGDGAGGGDLHGGEDGEQADDLEGLQQVLGGRCGSHGCGLPGPGSERQFGLAREGQEKRRKRRQGQVRGQLR